MPDSRFKPYRQNQLRLLPLDLSEMVPGNHLARVIDRVVESLDIRALMALYPGGGAPAYDPRMMLKVVLFAYSSGVYSSRKISEATRSNVYFLWLTGCTPLDHMTINRFRTERLRGVFEGMFTDVVLLLAELGHVTLGTYFLDGTKIEANANKYSFTWKKASEGYREKLRARIGELLDEVDAIDEEEDRIASGLPEPEELTSKDLDEIARRLNARLKEKPNNKKIKKALKQVEGDFSERMRRYERDLDDMKSRKSLSKTDRDATFMRMKEDRMGNGQLKAAYNVQIGTENQYVVHATVHQRPGDTACMKPHLKSLKQALGRLPSRIVADAGYGGEENYAYLQAEGSQAFVKYQMFHKEQKRKFRNDPAQPANWSYDAEADEWECSGGRRLCFLFEKAQRSGLGYRSMARVYGCPDCSGCEHAGACLRNGAENRRIYVNPRYARFKKQAAERLTSDEGIDLRRRRATDVETVFGDVKRNWSFKRFTLRGIEKVSHEWRLLMMGHNLRKLAKALSGKEPARMGMPAGA